MTDDPFDFLPEPMVPTDARNLIPDFVMDQLSDDMNEYECSAAYAYHLISKFGQPKKLETARGYLLHANSFLIRLAELAPEIFDEVMTAYAERALQFDQQNAA